MYRAGATTTANHGRPGSSGPPQTQLRSRILHLGREAERPILTAVPFSSSMPCQPTDPVARYRKAGDRAITPFASGETRTRTGDTTIFSRARRPAPGWRNPWKSCGFGRDTALTRCSRFADTYRRLWEWRAPQAQISTRAVRCQEPGPSVSLGGCARRPQPRDFLELLDEFRR
jgi:hypothetical protein